MSVEIHTFPLGPLETNTYVVRCGSDCWVIDPSLWPASLLAFLADEGIHPQRVLLTHGHGDHIAGIADLREAFADLKIVCPRADVAMLGDPRVNLSMMVGFPIRLGPPDETVAPGAELALGQSKWRVLDTSGHTPGGVSYYCPEAATVFTGDALFAGSVGRSDIPGGDSELLLRNIRDHLLTLPDETRVLPGHGPTTTIGAERRSNICLRGL